MTHLLPKSQIFDLFIESIIQLGFQSLTIQRHQQSNIQKRKSVALCRSNTYIARKIWHNSVSIKCVHQLVIESLPLVDEGEL